LGSRTTHDPEVERRVLYVGMTRAKARTTLGSPLR